VDAVRAGHVKPSLLDALVHAPAPDDGSSNEIVAARYHIAKLELELARARRDLAKLQRSRELRVGQRIVSPLRSLKRLLRR
jgi:hypothetical protein